MATVKDEHLELLAWCAMSYDKRLPNGFIPSEVWEALTPEARNRINTWISRTTDQFGAETRMPRRSADA